VTRFHTKSSRRLCFTWTCVLIGRQVDTRLMLWKKPMPDHVMVLARVFLHMLYLLGCWFF